MKESKHVRAKIFAGYLLLLAAGLFALREVWSGMTTLSQADPYGELLHQRRNTVNLTLYRLYRAERAGQFMLFGGAEYEREFREGMKSVKSSIDSLRVLASDSVQAARLDSISVWIAAKERTMMRLRRSFAAGSAEKLLAENIERLLPADSGRADTAITASEAREVTLDTVLTERPKRRFFRRFADLFSPPKEEKSVVVSTRIRVDTATLRLADTLSGVLHRLEENLSNDSRSVYEKAWRESARLARENRRIDGQIYRLLSQWESDEAAHLAERAESLAVLRHRASRRMGAWALTATVLVLIFTAVLWRDIDRSNRYKRQLERADREKAALLALREKLMLAVTHDFRAPLGSILGYTDLLSRLTRGRREAFYLENIRSASEHLSALVESLLDLWRLDARKAEIRCVRFHPVRLFREIADAHRPAAAEKGLYLRCETEAEEGRVVAGDPVRIRQIADNLLSNALKFTEKGGIVLRLSLDEENLFFSVSDTGRGMTREETARIFREFERLESAGGTEGFGLGLSIVDRAVRLMGGSVVVDSVPGRGSRFLVTLPLSAGPEPAEEEPLPRLRVLLVDDDPLQLKMTAGMCREMGLDALPCDRPEYAAKWAAKERFDLLLTDLQMPGTDGFELLKQLRSAGCDLPVIAVSGRVESEEALKSHGFAAWLRKPFLQRELGEAIRKVCGGANLSPERAAEPAGLDALTAFAAGDRAAERDILISFADRTSADGRELEQALADGDGQKAAGLSHRLLPLFRLLGRSEAVGPLERLERGETCTDEELARLFATLRECAAEAERRAAGEE